MMAPLTEKQLSNLVTLITDLVNFLDHWRRLCRLQLIAMLGPGGHIRRLTQLGL